MLLSNSIGAGRAAIVAAALVVLHLAATDAEAATCGRDGRGFATWLADFKGKARAAGISQRAIESGLAGVSYDANVIRRDRSQKSFKLSFEDFYRRRATGIIGTARAKKRTHAALLARIEKTYGVPGELLVSIWGLETYFGRDGSGNYSIVRSVATLAYDCRRSAFFTDHLMSALRIIDKGDMRASELRGGWAGEIGQVQFLPGSYDRYAVDFDGDGRRDLVHSVADALASTANFMRAHGWQSGEKWSPGTANFQVIKDWNKADVYARTIALMAERVGGR